MWSSRDALPDGILTGGVELPIDLGGGSGEPLGVVAGPGGVYLLNQGGMTIKQEPKP